MTVQVYFCMYWIDRSLIRFLFNWIKSINIKNSHPPPPKKKQQQQQQNNSSSAITMTEIMTGKNNKQAFCP